MWACSSTMRLRFPRLRRLQAMLIRTTWGELLRDSTDELSTARLADSRRIARWICADVLGCSFAELLAYPDRQATRAQADSIRSSVRRCAGHEPVQYVLGYAAFRGLRIRVTPSVLIPRPETEQVAGAALSTLEYLRGPRVLDIGTGSGCIALAIKNSRPDADVTACDVSVDALQVARDNSSELALAVRLVQADALADSFLDIVEGDYDLVVSNPPYLSRAELESLEPEVRDHEPSVALCAGEDPMLFYRQIGGCLAPALLGPAGCLVLETHAFRADSVCNVLRRTGFAEVHVLPDLAGHSRIVCARKSGGDALRRSPDRR